MDMTTSTFDAPPERSRVRPQRVQSEEQKLILDIRSTINRADNPNRRDDMNVLLRNRKTNRDTHDLMLAFHKIAPAYSLYKIEKIHGVLVNYMEHASEVMDIGAMEIAFLIHGSDQFIASWGTRAADEGKVQLIAYALSSGADRDLVASIIRDRGIKDIETIKMIVSEMKQVHSSLSSGAL